MLTELFPRDHGRFSSLPVLGPTMDGFAQWLCERGYPRASARRHIRASRGIDPVLRQRGIRQLSGIAASDLSACSGAKEDVVRAAAVRSLSRYLEERGLLATVSEAPSRSRALLSVYADYLRDVRGFARGTLESHLRSATQILERLDYETTPSRLSSLSGSDLEDFLKAAGRHQGRGTLQHTVSHIRGFLRFLAARGEVSSGLEARIDTPRLYRLEQLPRALPWETVRAFLRSIDRTTPIGRRDYAMFVLICTYGLRSCDVAALKLDDIDWRGGHIRIAQRKGGSPLSLPLTDEVGAALLSYLRRGRPKLACREVFLRCRAPAGVLKPTAVTEAFQGWSRRSGLKIPFQGPHCLRHSYAVHLLRRGVPLKTIGDVLGHRSAEATCMYLRLSIEDLRDVALAVPKEIGASRPQEVEP